MNFLKKHFREWVPHFQIDIDATLAIKELRKITTRCFGPGFIKWEMNIPNLGVVLAMGILGEVNGTKIVLGIGTKLRGTKYFRDNILKEL